MGARGRRGRRARFTLKGVLGGLAARGEHHDDVWAILGVEQPAARGGSTTSTRRAADDPVTPAGRTRCLGSREHAARDRGAASAPRRLRRLRRALGRLEPEPGFFARRIEEADVPPDKIAYVGDRVDNDILPALAAGLVAVHVRRGPWGLLHEAPAGAIWIRSLAELPAVLA